MSRFVVCLVILCTVPTVSFGQERPTQSPAASFGYQGMSNFDDDGFHGVFGRLVFNTSGRLAGVVQLYGGYDPKNVVARWGDETYHSSGGDTVVLVSGGLRLQGRSRRLVPHAQVLIGAGASRTETTVVRTAPGSGATTRQNRRTSAGFLTQIGVGLTIRMSDRMGVTTTFDVLPSFPNPFRAVCGFVTSVGMTITL